MGPPQFPLKYVMFCDNKKFCANPRCVLHVSANDDNVVGHGEWATLPNGHTFARVRIGAHYFCHACADNLNDEDDG